MGFSFGELVVLALVALIVIGPKDLPKILRTAGRTIGSLRRLVTDVRRETGLDEVLRGDFQDLERLADHIERLDKVEKPEAEETPSLPSVADEAARREREWPRMGADAYGMLPEDAQVYADVEAKIRAAEGILAQGDPYTTSTPSGEVPAT